MTGENPNCTKFDVNDICVKCEEGFELDNNKICQLGNITNTTIILPQAILAKFDNCLIKNNN